MHSSGEEEDGEMAGVKYSALSRCEISDHWERE